MPVSLPEGEVGVSVSFRTISLPFEAIRAEYLSRTQWLRKGRPSCPFCTRYKLAPWPKTYDRYIYLYIYIQTHPLYYSYMWGSLRLAPIIDNMASWLINWPGALGFYLQPITLLHYDNFTLEFVVLSF